MSGLRGLLAGFGIVALLATALWLHGWLDDPHSLPIRTVTVEGDFRFLDPAELYDAAVSEIEGGFFVVEIERVRGAIEALPWVSQASVRRVWPDRLHAQVVEQVPLARWGEAALVNGEGARFEPPADQLPPGLPSLDGPLESEERVVQRFYELADVLALAGLELIALRLDERRAWSAELAGGIELVMGRDEGNAALYRFVAVWRSHLAQTEGPPARRIDLRHTNGFAVRFANG